MPHLGIVDAGLSAPQPRSAAISYWKSPEITVSAALFAKFQQLIYRETGIWLSESKTALLCGRLSRRIRALQLRSLSEYYQIVVQPDQHDERMLMIDAITTNETRFFREPRHFDYLADTVVPQWRRLADKGLRSRKIRIWSAGCSTGEEAYSLAIAWHEYLGEAMTPTEITIFGTYLSDINVERARAAVYSEAAMEGVSGERLRRFFVKIGRGYQVARRVREMCVFARHDLTRDPPFARMDMISCRNVLIYLTPVLQKKVLEFIHYALQPTGFLILGKPESPSAAAVT